jgi:hypothetical protein
VSFYNRRASLSVTNPLNFSGQTQPLDVVEYGGQFQASHTFAGAGSAVLLGAPPGGSESYRLHRFIEGSGAGGVTAVLTGTTSGFLYAISVAASVDNCMGQLVGEGLTVTVTAAMTVYLTYDVVTTPSIA